MKKKELKIVLEQMKKIEIEADKGIDASSEEARYDALLNIKELLSGATQIIGKALMPKPKEEKKKNTKTPTQFIKDRGLEIEFKRFKMEGE